MVFCNMKTFLMKVIRTQVTILILIDGFLQYVYDASYDELIDVTILILIDGFLQFT